MTPFAPYPRTNSSDTSHGWISQYTFASRTRRAINCVTCEPKSRIRILSCTNYLLHTIIRRLFDDLHVVDVRLAHACGSDLDELRLGAHIFDGRATAIAHARAQAPHQLENDAEDTALVRHAALDAFRHELVDVVG